jgi:acetyl esterase
MNRDEFISMASHFTEQELHIKAELMRERAASRIPVETQQEFHSLDDVTTVQAIMQETGYAHGPTHLYLVHPNGTMQETLPVMINVHGGGWTMPHTERDIYFSRRMAHRLHILVVDVDYVLAPEHPYPAALEEMDALFAALPQLLPMWQGDPDNIVLCGQSAGGNLIGAVMERKHFSKIPGIKAQILCYLPTDNFNDHFGGEELDPRGMDTELYGFFYNRNFADRKNFDVSLLYSTAENLAGLPHTDIVTCGQDNLMPEGEKYYKLMTRSGISTSYRCFEKSRHGFLVNLYDEYQAGEDYVAELAAKHLGL